MAGSAARAQPVGQCPTAQTELLLRRGRRCCVPRASRRPATRAVPGRPECSGVTPGIGTNSTACRLPRVIVPVLSSSSVLTSPAASTERPLMAITFCWITRSMPAMPIADSSPPIVVGMRQTSSATRTGVAIGVPTYIAKGCSVTTASRKTMVRPDRRMVSAISLGVFVAPRPPPARSCDRGTSRPGSR